MLRFPARDTRVGRRRALVLQGFASLHPSLVRTQWRPSGLRPGASGRSETSPTHSTTLTTAGNRALLLARHPTRRAAWLTSSSVSLIATIIVILSALSRRWRFSLRVSLAANAC